MSKRISNPKDVTDSNPLIETFPGDTFSRTTAVLEFLQYSLTLADGTGDSDPMTERATTGLYYVFETVIDAIEKQAAVIDAYERQPLEVNDEQ